MRVGVHGTRGRMRALSCLIALSAALMCTRVAAQTSGGLALATELAWRVEGCAQLPTVEVARLLALELATQPSAAAASSDAPRIALRCQGLEVRVSIERSGIQSGIRAAPLELTLDLAESRPEARARVLALAIAELIATVRLEPADAPALAAPEPAREPVRLGLFLEGGGARVLEPAVIAPAFALGALQRWAAFSLQADVALQLATVQGELATVRARELSLSLTPGWHLSGKRLDLGLALGVRAGHARLSATAAEADQRGRAVSGWVLIPIARATLELVLLRALGVRLGLEAGYIVKPLRGLDADGQSLVAVRGLRVAALLGVIVWLDGL